MSETTMVYDAKDKILGRLASHVAKEMISARTVSYTHLTLPTT